MTSHPQRKSIAKYKRFNLDYLEMRMLQYKNLHVYNLKPNKMNERAYDFLIIIDLFKSLVRLQNI